VRLAGKLFISLSPKLATFKTGSKRIWRNGATACGNAAVWLVPRTRHDRREDPARKAAMTSKTTYIFKTAGDCAIQADVYRGVGAGPRPAIMWLHGGALMFGHRGMAHPAQIARYVTAGYSVIAVDYRLAPETKLPAILSDVHDAIAWVRDEGPIQFGIDPEHVAVVGHSAGGYLALLAGATVNPRPQALVAFYGYGDIIGPWYTTPSTFYRQQPLVSDEEAQALVGASALSEAPRLRDADFDPSRDRSRFYLYCRQQGRWPEAATGLDPCKDPGAFAPFCPVRQVTASYPPTLLLHGDRDTDVPYDQSVMMARALAHAQVPHRLVTIPSGEHGFDSRMDDPDVAAAFAGVLTFLADHV
jgi:acetyl esterase/lipase